MRPIVKTNGRVRKSSKGLQRPTKKGWPRGHPFLVSYPERRGKVTFLSQPAVRAPARR